MKKWLVIVFFGLFFISIDSVSADSCYFNIVNKNVSRNHFVSADIGINKFISNVNEAIFFISYDSNALSVNEKNIIINNNWNVKLLDVIKDKNNLETLVVKIGNNEYLKESANLKFLNINFNVKSSFDLNETIVTFSSNVDNGYYKSMSKIYNVNDINNQHKIKLKRLKKHRVKFMTYKN